MYCVLAEFLIFQSSLIEKMDLLMDPKSDHLGTKNNDFLKKLVLDKANSLPNHLWYFKSQSYQKLYQFGKHFGSPKAPKMTKKFFS